MSVTQNIVVMNWYLDEVLKSIRAGDAVSPGLNDAGGELHLYTNDLTPTPAHEDESDYTEATYNDYAALTTSNKFQNVVKIQDGQYSSTSELFQFALPSGGGDQTIYGVYMTQPGSVPGEVILAARLANPHLIEVGGDPLSVRIIYDNWSGNVLIAQACV